MISSPIAILCSSRLEYSGQYYCKEYSVVCVTKVLIKLSLLANLFQRFHFDKLANRLNQDKLVGIGVRHTHASFGKISKGGLVSHSAFCCYATGKTDLYVAHPQLPAFQRRRRIPRYYTLLLMCRVFSLSCACHLFLYTFVLFSVCVRLRLNLCVHVCVYVCVCACVGI